MEYNLGVDLAKPSNNSTPDCHLSYLFPQA